MRNQPKKNHLNGFLTNSWHDTIRFVDTYDIQNQNPFCLSLTWQIDFGEIPKHIAFSDNRLLVSSNKKMCSFHVGKNARQIWKKPFNHNNDFQLYSGKHLFSFDSTGFITIYDFLTGRYLLEGITPKAILGVHAIDNALAVVTKDSVTLFDTRLFQWTGSVKRNISKTYFGYKEVLLVYDCGTAVVLNLSDLSEYNIPDNNNCKILDAKYFDKHFACLYCNGKMAIIDCFGQQILSMQLNENLPKILLFDENSTCISDGGKVMNYSLDGNNIVWSTDFSEITAFAQSKGVLCVGQPDGVVFFIESSNGRILAAFEGTSQTVSITNYKGLWILGFEDGNIFALSLLN